MWHPAHGGKDSGTYNTNKRYVPKISGLREAQGKLKGQQLATWCANKNNVQELKQVEYQMSFDGPYICNVTSYAYHLCYKYNLTQPTGEVNSDLSTHLNFGENDTCIWKESFKSTCWYVDFFETGSLVLALQTMSLGVSLLLKKLEDDELNFLQLLDLTFKPSLFFKKSQKATG